MAAALVEPPPPLALPEVPPVAEGPAADWALAGEELEGEEEEEEDRGEDAAAVGEAVKAVYPGAVTAVNGATAELMLAN